ncbi:MAG TPA: GSCFA domain-containing protein [Rhizomicrobium sp.]|nr:GSCFA domain-containing protein [Rhizomicrobium sp.]
MPLRIISGADAIANIRANPNGEWPAREPADTNRLQPYCKPAFSPTFTLIPGEKIFTIGSCFARNIESALEKRGFDVVTRSLEWPDKFFDFHGQTVLNNYGVVSIENELRWALDPDRPFDPKTNILQVAPEKYLDPHLSVRPTNMERMLAYRAAVTGVSRRVVECRVVIMTLGLSELWFDTLTGIYLNLAPPRRLVMQNPGRFEVRLLNFEETLAATENVIALLRQHCRADQRILLTVSPVPMSATHSERDAIVVNSYSKSVLRTAAEHVAAAHAHIDYFPSYESVTLTDPNRAWLDDQLHVRDVMINLNVDRMLDAYLPQDQRMPVATKLIVRNAREEIDAGQPETAARTLAPLREAKDIEPDFALDYTELCLELGRRADAAAIIEKLPVKGNVWRRKAIEVLLQIHDGQVEEGVAAMWALAESMPKTPIVWRALTDMLVDLKRWDEALIAARRWSAATSGKPGPFRRAAIIHRAKGDIAAADFAYREMMAALGVEDVQMLEYVEFLVEQKRFDEAAREIVHIKPETTVMVRKLDELKTFLPSAPALAKAS